MSIIALVSSKGGAGKSTAAGALAGAYAQRGDEVLVLDLDDNRTLWTALSASQVPGITVEKVEVPDFSRVLQERAGSGAFDRIIVDVPGASGEALALAIGRSHVSIIPARLSRADVDEAYKTAHRMLNLFASFGKRGVFRVLVSAAPSIESASETNARQVIDELQMPRFVTELKHRAPYNELFATGKPPHFNDIGRENVRRAVAELDALVMEIDALIDVGVAGEGRGVATAAGRGGS